MAEQTKQTAPKRAEQAQAATERPWRLGREGTVVADAEAGTHRMSDDDLEYYGGVLVAESVFSANAALIVRAVNSYDAMREAHRLNAVTLRNALAWLDAQAKSSPELGAVRPLIVDALTRTDAALALANPEASQEQP